MDTIDDVCVVVVPWLHLAMNYNSNSFVHHRFVTHLKKPDTIATQTQKYDSRLFRKNKEQTGLVLLELCIYPDSEVISVCNMNI